ncbi:MAG: four helix bundle protein [bacterium]|nr:four helix bundle protein [bacterium]
MEKLRTKTSLRERAYQYSLKIIKLVDNLPKQHSAQVIGAQLLRSATSIGANITEAQAGSSRKDFANFYSYSLKSANETKYWLGLLKDSKKVTENVIAPLLQEVCEIANILGASILTLKKRKL